jgi:superfamily II DNA or RNA helicase
MNRIKHSVFGQIGKSRRNGTCVTRLVMITAARFLQLRRFLKVLTVHLVCTHATFRFAVDRFGVEVFDDCLIAVDEFHHVSANPDNKLGAHLGQFMARDKVHIVAMTGSYFRGDAEAVLSPQDESKFEAVTYTYYEQLNGYQYLKQLDIGYYFYSGSYTDEILSVWIPEFEKTILFISPMSIPAKAPSAIKSKRLSEIIHELGEWQGRMKDPVTGFHLVKTR